MGTPIDFTPFISKIAVGGIVLAVVSIAAGFAVVLVARSGAFQVLRTFFNKHDSEIRFQGRYRREQRNREYRAWKSKRGY